jgi:hypothetical protein
MLRVFIDTRIMFLFLLIYCRVQTTLGIQNGVILLNIPVLAAALKSRRNDCAKSAPRNAIP